MNEVALEFNHVWKKFKRGEKYDSLRDLIPAMTKRLFSRNHGEELEEKEFWAVKDVSFQVKRGEALGIIGPNGAGKSTILKLLSGILRPNKGEMKVNGRLSALIEVGAGFHPDLTGRENIYLNGSILGMKRQEIDSKFDEIVAFSELEEFIDTPVKRFSSGMYARLGFSVAAHLDPDILLVDEVLSVGDISFQGKCSNKMAELRQKGISLIIISHNLQMIEGLCDRGIFLEHGKVCSEGFPNAIVREYKRYVTQKGKTKYETSVIGEPLDVGSQTLEITSVQFLDENGKEKKIFKPDEKMTVKVFYFAARRYKRCIFSIAVLRPDNLACCVAKSKYYGVEPCDIEGEGCFEVEFERVLLNSGAYTVAIAIFDSGLVAPYAIRCRDTFEVESPIPNVENDAGVFVPLISWRAECRNTCGGHQHDTGI